MKLLMKKEFNTFRQFVLVEFEDTMKLVSLFGIVFSLINIGIILVGFLTTFTINLVAVQISLVLSLSLSFYRLERIKHPLKQWIYFIIWIFSLSYILPFTFFNLFLLNQHVLAGSIMFVVSIAVFILLLGRFELILPLILFALNAGGVVYVSSVEMVILSDNLGTTLTIAFIFAVYLLLTEERKQRIYKEKILFQKAISGSIAHELRTPISSISNFSNSLNGILPDLIDTYLKAYPDELSPMKQKTLKNSLRYIKESCKETFFTIDLLLHNIKPVTVGNQRLCSIRDVVQEAIKFYPDTNLEDKIQLNIEDDISFEGDPILFKHVMFNLLKNAIQAIQEAGSGKIYIYTTKKAPSSHCLHVKDTGCGISEENLGHMFELFYTKKNSGTGLGLHFCKSVMEGANGYISCKSKQGVYTEFILQFPPDQI